MRDFQPENPADVIAGQTSRDNLEPSAMPIGESDEQSFTNYDVTWIGQKDNREISNAAAAATMALMGCDINKSLTGVENELNGDTSSNIIIYKITKLLKEEKEKRKRRMAEYPVILIGQRHLLR